MVDTSHPFVVMNNGTVVVLWVMLSTALGVYGGQFCQHQCSKPTI